MADIAVTFALNIVPGKTNNAESCDGECDKKMYPYSNSVAKIWHLQLWEFGFHGNGRP